LHLTGLEVERLLAAAKDSRNEIRDRCLVLLTFRHGMRVSEARGLKLDQVDPESRVLHVIRLKHGLSTTHPLRADELRTINAWLKVRASMKVPANVKRSLSAASASRCTARLSICCSENTAQRLPCRCTLARICCAMAAALPWPTRARIPADSGLSGTQKYPAHSTVHGG
jgi:type 1 fimbriae regulatory protein FimB